MKKYKYDIILIAILLIITLIGFIVIGIPMINNPRGNLHARIYSDNELIEDVDLAKLDKIKEISVTGAHSEMIIHIGKDGVYVKDSGCKNQICVHEGKKLYDGAIITCLPNKVYIEIVEI